MAERSTRHATFVVERDHAATPARVFAAWADAGSKARWFVGPDSWKKAPHARIILAYDMHRDDLRISVSLATIELEPGGTGTRLVYTEQGVFLDGYDDVAGRGLGTRTLLDELDAELRRSAAT